MIAKQLEEIIAEYASKGYTSKETLEHITIMVNELLDNEVDLSNLMNLGQVYIDVEKTYASLNDDVLTEARNNLYELNLEEEPILKNTLYELSQYDKLIDYDGISVPFLLNQVILMLSTYMNLLPTPVHSDTQPFFIRTVCQ